MDGPPRVAPGGHHRTAAGSAPPALRAGPGRLDENDRTGPLRARPGGARGVDMSTVDIGPDEMQTRVVRFRELSPRPKPSVDDVPPEVTDFMTADRNYSYMAPAMEKVSVIQKFAAMTGGDAGDAISVSVAVCSPGRGPALHAHFNTVEAFFCLSSQFA